ncbi:DUF975 family protein [Paenibacillus sp. 453mf]|uniref:DUF975 family protein n=1 Tax=Paenibacillus sp. 453mf TaxID=1761874 RepID=UPI0008E049EB|nr:DUF975 family protein [Paenibacillus sp. 453mf]SFS81206.1 Protein of unknown function [Paenibacillus sp. 453mf]
MNISILDTKRRAISSLQGTWWRVLILTVLIGILTLIIPLIFDIRSSGGYERWKVWEESVFEFNDLNLLLGIVIIPLLTSVFWFYLDLVRSYDPWLTELFEVYRDGEKVLKLIWTAITACFLLLMWTLLLVVPGIIKLFSYSQTPYILQDHPEYSALQAITESKRLMDGYKWNYFVFLLSFLGWGVLTAASLGLAWLFVGPYFSAAQAAFYDELRRINKQPAS